MWNTLDRQHNGSRLPAGLGSALDRFLPAGILNSDLDACHRARLVVLFSWILLFAGIPYAVLYWCVGSPTCALAAAAAVIVGVGVLLLLRTTGAVVASGNLATADLFTALTVIGFHQGGPLSPALLWYAAIPIVAMGLTGRRWAVGWTIATLASLLTLVGLETLGYEFSQELTPWLEGLIHPIALGTATILILILTWLHESFKDGALARLRESEQFLQRAKHAAEAASRAKSDFLANVSHEIRTPMTAILGFSENLLDDDLSERDRVEAIGTIRRNGDHLLQIINDVLDLSKIEAGRLQPEQIECSPVQLVAEVESLMRPRVTEKGISFDVEYAGPIPEIIRTDPTRVRQILINLLGNAVKFTQAGGVRLVTRLIADPRPDGPSLLRFDVVDTGIGMSAAQIEKLFQPFQQADTSTTRRFGGTGLGLTISKRLAEALGGELIVESSQGEGSTFRVTIATGPLGGVRMLGPSARRVTTPTASPALTPPASSVPPIRLDARVLLVEDGPDNQRLLTFILRKAGAEVALAVNGREGAEQALLARDAGRPFDVILMDMQMPVMDGYAATRLLRENGYAGRIVALTAHAMTDDRQKCLDAGCDDFITKPVNARALVESVRVHVQVP